MDSTRPLSPANDSIGGDSSARSRLRVLVVEDHLDTREMLCMLLQMYGHDVVTAQSKREALSAAPAAHCDVLLTDIGLPDGTGWDLLRELGSAAPPYALAMSGYGMDLDLAKSKAAGFRHHMIKPMGQDQLQNYLHEAAMEISVS